MVFGTLRVHVDRVGRELVAFRRPVDVQKIASSINTANFKPLAASPTCAPTRTLQLRRPNAIADVEEAAQVSYAHLGCGPSADPTSVTAVISATEAGTLRVLGTVTVDPRPVEALLGNAP